MRHRTAIMLDSLLFTLILLLAGPLNCMADGTTAVSAQRPLVIVFEANKTELSITQKTAIRSRFSGKNLSAADKIFVVGYSDTSGDRAKNERLSYQRAQVVQKVIVDALGSGMNAPEVLVLGQGQKDPVADNRRKDGRAKNRRVEVYLGRIIDSAPAGKDETVPLELQVVEPLVLEAMRLLRRQRLPEALKVLHEAHHHGGEHYSRWHTAQGIAAYYAGIDVQRAKPYLLTALRLDPFDGEARDYLGRLKALESVTSGQVSSDMGRHADAPIPVMAAAQAHEYLRLFKVQPLSRRRLAPGPVEVWVCRDRQGAQVSYYFDHAQVHAWSFGLDAPAVPVAPRALSDTGRITLAAPAVPSVKGGGSGTQAQPNLPPGRIWDIMLFR